MALVSEIITQVRVNLDDLSSTRWSDTPILSLIKTALRRAENICIRKGLEFAKSSDTLTLLDGASTVALPTDFKRDIGMYYNYAEIDKVDIDYFERHSGGTMWRINGTNAEFKTEATGDIDYTLWYYPLIDFSAYTTASTMPWSSRLDDIIVDYVTMRLGAIDEYDTSMEQQFLSEMERNILETYGPLTATVQEMNGYSEI
ncbi:MAG: hypothetical protein DRP02_12730 [Candidatus Gerdarchaeota archaeon]|nr:MAG: hypothetical protein DRP02_12730 [Candidatus Gerdarchaeota archaeon]